MPRFVQSSSVVRPKCWVMVDLGRLWHSCFLDSKPSLGEVFLYNPDSTSEPKEQVCIFKDLVVTGPFPFHLLPALSTRGRWRSYDVGMRAGAIWLTSNIHEHMAYVIISWVIYCTISQLTATPNSCQGTSIFSKAWRLFSWTLLKGRR